MAELLKAYNAWVARSEPSQLLPVDCPQCEKPVQNARPPMGACWDSLMTCPYCEALIFKIAYHDRVSATLVEAKAAA